MAQSGGGDGGIDDKRAELSSSGAGAAAEDRLSALPDDVLVLILLRLGNTAEAARTSVLSRRWRRVWALLPELLFHLAPGGHRIREVLLAPDAPPLLRGIGVLTKDFAPDSLGAWLPDAARRLSGDLIYYVKARRVEEGEEEDGVGERDTVMLPCFENATGMLLNLGFLGLALPFAGTFARLIKLELPRVRLHGPCELSDVVSSQRCPSLQKLVVDHACGCGVDKLTIHSESLLQVDLCFVKGLRQLTIIAPVLKELKLVACFVENQPVANISAPALLEWRDSYNPTSVNLGNLGQLQQLNTDSFRVFCEHDSGQNREVQLLLQQFQFIHILKIRLGYWRDISNLLYSIEDISMLPHTTLLTMEVSNEGHDFGPSSFHMLRLCTGIRRLTLVLHTSFGLESACQSGCNCDQPSNWKAEELSLNQLEEAEIAGLKGAEHEVIFVE